MKIKYSCGYDEQGNWYCQPENIAPRANKKSLNVLFDDMQPTLHPCDQKIYTSKAKFRETTRQHGKEEIGNEYNSFVKTMRPEIKRTPVSQSLKESYDFLEACHGKSEGEKREMEARFYREY